MERQVKDKNILNKFVEDFIQVVDKNRVKYAIVSGFVAISHGRSRGTEDIDLIIEKLSFENFKQLHNDLVKTGFDCIQGTNPLDLFNDYLIENSALRYTRKSQFIPEMEVKFAKDALDEKQIAERVKLPLTNLPFYFSSIETNIAFKEELLKSPKDIGDARHLRIIYSEKLDEKKISELKKLVKKYRLGG
ncbi:MAG: hypothetical protein HY392_03260 [Candidatus Diapherotrites archaeon]|nr:hypothetical protein [Candidatus Diapherotrites archaeon]